jgi:hypothetical protein
VSFVGAAATVWLVARRPELRRLWVLVAGGVVMYTAYRWWQSVADRDVGGNVLVAANARPTPDRVSAAITMAADRPYPSPGWIGAGLVLLLLIIQLVLIQGRVSSRPTTR